MLTASDLAGAVRDIPPRPTPELEGMQVPEHPVLARQEVCYVGQPVAVIVAQDRYLLCQRPPGPRRGAEEALLGVGLATVVKASGGSGEMKESHALVRVEPTGQVTVYTEVSPHGQGTETTFAQIVTDELGVRPEDVQVQHGDTAMLASGQGMRYSPEGQPLTWQLAGLPTAACQRYAGDTHGDSGDPIADQSAATSRGLGSCRLSPVQWPSLMRP